MNYEGLKKVILLFFFWLIHINGVAQIDNHIRDFVNDSSFRHAGISICFRDAESGDLIAEHNKDMALGSASVMKLVTTAVALEKLGPDFRFATRIGYTGYLNPSDSILKGYIVIKGGADPTILSEYFPDYNKDIIDKWVDDIANTGIKEIGGAVVSDAIIFNYHPAPGGWSWSDLGNYYGAGAHGICIFDNMYRIHFKTGNEGSKPEITGIEPDIPGLLIENRLTSYGETDNGYVYLEPYGNHAVIRGEIPPGRDDFVLKASIPDPPLLAAYKLQDALKERGIRIHKNPTSLRLSPDIAEAFRYQSKEVITTTWSPPLSDIITITNTESVNMFAEQLIKYLGFVSKMTEFSSKDNGLKAIREYLTLNLEAGTQGLYIADGSGLSRSNALSAAFITSLLHFMKSKSRYSDVLYESLAEAGKSGTLENYFNDPVFHDNLRAKSGTSTRIRNYAGFFTTQKGNEVTFAILVNNFDCSSSEVTGQVEKFLKKIIEEY